jgi:hypothetical protein
MSWTVRFLYAAATLLALAALLAYAFPANAQSRIYDQRGTYRGRIEPSPYSGRCCVVYDQRGNYQGRVEGPREPTRSTGRVYSPLPDRRRN